MWVGSRSLWQWNQRPQNALFASLPLPTAASVLLRDRGIVSLEPICLVVQLRTGSNKNWLAVVPEVKGNVFELANAQPLWWDHRRAIPNAIQVFQRNLWQAEVHCGNQDFSSSALLVFLKHHEVLLLLEHQTLFWGCETTTWELFLGFGTVS